LFLLSYLNFNLPNIIFSNLVLILYISSFLSWSFCKSFNGFQFYLLIQIDGAMFSNLVISVLISNFFSLTFVKVIILYDSPFNYNIIFIFMSILSLIFKIYFYPFTKLIYFQFHSSINYNFYFVF
jgi:hypothetical protein